MYVAAREGVATALLDERAVLAVAGPDRQKFLHNVLSNDVQGRKPGQGCLAALLDVKGHIIALMRVLVSADSVLLEMLATRLGRVEAVFAHYKVAAPVRFSVPPTSVIALLGPKARDALAAIGAPAPAEAPESHVDGQVEGHAVRVARASDLPAAGLVLHVAQGGARAVLGALGAAGASPLDRSTLDTLRIEDGKPWYGPDVTEENLLHETGLVAAYHSPTKGCYVGQEVVARLEGRGGHVNKRLRGLRLSVAATAGASVLAERKEAGRVTTAGVSPEYGPIALAYVHRTHAEPGSSVVVEGAPATVVALPIRG